MTILLIDLTSRGLQALQLRAEEDEKEKLVAQMSRLDAQLSELEMESEDASTKTDGCDAVGVVDSLVAKLMAYTTDTRLA